MEGERDRERQRETETEGGEEGVRERESWQEPRTRLAILRFIKCMA